jgi:hypothetical protein
MAVVGPPIWQSGVWADTVWASGVWDDGTGSSYVHVNDALNAYLRGLYVPGTYTSADLATLIQHHLGTLTGDYTSRWKTMIAAAT